MNEETPFPENIDSYSIASTNVDSVINLIAILHVLTGLLFIPYILIIFNQSIISGPIFFTVIVYLVVGLILTTLPIFFILGLAIWSVRTWAWKTSVITNAICFILTILGQIIFPAMLNIVLLLMLNNADVKDALQK